ncbi:hypothetical protein TSUD_118390 [Trifolium subterraneum]|uniref:Uncharacterized protein n=1 Tax=Trifolium subterraneum TaxID=3900 RepID=A0A2Z6MTA2_TRISU|nr:hypothetical protein TSUD_118390 [Trifolium subterraneum]
MNHNNNNILHYYPEEKVWNNAAFDGDDFTMKTSWSSSSNCTKENLSPTALNTIFPSSKKNKKTLDDEIAEIEFEIKRLTSKLESLRIEKAERKIASEKRVSGIGTGRIVGSKFMEPKKNSVVFKEVTPKRNGVVFKEDTPMLKRNGGVLKEDTPMPKGRVNWRRGMSLGPAEIAGKVIAPAITPATVNRRKSCFFKPPESCEESRRKTICKANLVSAAAAVGSIKRVKKKDEEIVQVVQPKKLFEGEKSAKKVMKQGRVVASRYNSGGDVRKRSFCENNKSLGSEIRVKKRWEIPIEEVNVSGFVMLPKISKMRCVDDGSPRDSGAAKRVAELKGKRSYFCDEEEEDSVMVEEQEGSICQVLNFAEEEDDDDGEQGRFLRIDGVLKGYVILDYLLFRVKLDLGGLRLIDFAEDDGGEQG